MPIAVVVEARLLILLLRAKLDVELVRCVAVVGQVAER